MANGLITKVQSVSITIATGSTTGTASITSVNTALSAVFFNGQTTNDTAANSINTDIAGVTLTNATTVTATRGASSGSFTVTVNATVVTFAASAISNIQQGTITMTGAVTSNTATITSVTTTDSCCLCNGFTISANAATGFCASKVVLTNATTVTATRAAASGTAVAYYTIITFASGVLNSSTQTGSINIANGGSSNTATITAVTASQSMVIWGGFNSADGVNSLWSDSVYLALTNGTTVTATANSTVSGSTGTTIPFTIVEFKSANIRSVNRGTITIATSSASNTASITAVNTSYAIPNFTGFSSGNAGGGVIGNISLTSLVLTNSTTVTAARNASSASFTTNTGWEIIEHNGQSNMFLVM